MLNNAYDILELVRDNVAEAVESHWSDLNLLRRINQAQGEIARLVSMGAGQWLVESTDLTPVDSIITLPADCAKPLYLEEKSSGSPISWLGSVTHRRVYRQIGTLLGIDEMKQAYPLRATIEVNIASYTTEVTLWYLKRVPDLHTGTAAAGGAASLTLQADRRPKNLTDYYNNVQIEIISGTGSGAIDTITDYSVAHVCTVTGTYSTSSIYGTISLLPEECMDYLILRATVLAMSKPSSNIDEKVYQMFHNDHRTAKNELIEWLQSRTAGSKGVTIGEPYL